MAKPNLEDELAAVRTQLLRLRHREQQLVEALQSEDGTPPPLRPGWPIRRTTGQALH